MAQQPRLRQLRQAQLRLLLPPMAGCPEAAAGRTRWQHHPPGHSAAAGQAPIYRSGQPTLYALTLGHPIRKQHRRKTAPSENGREAAAITCCKGLNNSPVAAASHCQMAGIAAGTRQCPCHRCRCRSAAIQRFLNGGRDGLDLGAQLLLNAVPASTNQSTK